MQVQGMHEALLEFDMQITRSERKVLVVGTSTFCE